MQKEMMLIERWFNHPVDDIRLWEMVQLRTSVLNFAASGRTIGGPSLNECHQ